MFLVSNIFFSSIFLSRVVDSWWQWRSVAVNRKEHWNTMAPFIGFDGVMGYWPDFSFCVKYVETNRFVWPVNVAFCFRPLALLLFVGAPYFCVRMQQRLGRNLCHLETFFSPWWIPIPSRVLVSVKSKRLILLWSTLCSVNSSSHFWCRLMISRELEISFQICPGILLSFTNFGSINV